jgi:hypothetical protein
MKRMLAAMVALIAVTPAVAASAGPLMDRASDGYVYFHRAGADPATHDAAVDACVREAKLTQEPYLAPVIAGPLTQLIIASTRAAKQQGLDRVQFAANLENCMVARGWEVVRLDDAEGKAIAALPQAGQAAALAPWVGAAAPHGQVVRRYVPIGAMSWESKYDDSPGPSSLSLTSGVHDLSRLEAPMADKPANWQPLKVGEAKTVLAPDASAIVVRVTGGAAAQTSWTFVRLDEPSTGAGGLSYFTITSPAKGSSATAKTYVIAAPPGHWRLEGVGTASFCLGGPTFDVGAGAAVFAGTFDAGAPYAPGFDPAPARADLADAALAARLEGAGWTNGEGFPCGVMQPNWIYVLEIPNIPYAAGYQAGSRAAP